MNGQIVKGSKRYLRELINEKPELLISKIKGALNCEELDIEFFSPLEDTYYKEYRDEKFLEKLGFDPEEFDELKKDLKDFWPKGGPCWDGLGKEKKKNGKIFLIEAKAHLSEIFSKPRAKAGESVKLINKAFSKISDIDIKILKNLPFYQYLNRMAYLHFLRKMHNIEAYLIFIYFLNSPHFHDAPKTIKEWESALYVQKRILDIKKDLHKYTKNIFIDIKELEENYGSQKTL